MNASRWSVARRVLIVFWIFASLQQSDAILWKKQPEKLTVLVEGVNNTGVSLVWEFVFDVREALRGVTFRRQRDPADPPVTIASSIDYGPFTVFPQFLSNYSASLPGTLNLKNAVTKDEEFIYSIEVFYQRNNQPVPGFKDTVQVEVQALRLVGGRRSGEGRVEIYYNSTWGTICDDSWGINDARVVCRQLGYPSAISAPRSASFGSGSGIIWLDDVQCQGNESYVGNCLHRPWGAHNCGHHEDASVICSNFSISLPNASSVSPSPAFSTPAASATPVFLPWTVWPSRFTMPTPFPSKTRPRFAFTISCFPSAMVAHIARDNLPLEADARVLHLNDPKCGVSYVDKKSVIIKVPLKGCGTVRRDIGYKVSFHNKVVVPSGYGNKRTLSVFPFKCVYSRFDFP